MKRPRPSKACMMVRKLFADALAAGPETLNDVWQIVTALRGPDDMNLIVKSHFTTPIRRAVLTRHQAIRLDVSACEKWPRQPRLGDCDRMITTNPPDVTFSQHLAVHARRAASSLVKKTTKR